MKTNRFRICATLPLILAATAAWAQAPAPHSMTHAGHTIVKGDAVHWVDGPPSLPKGAKIAIIEGPLDQAVPFTMRIKLPPNYHIPPHSHPAIEHVTVIAGSFHLGMGDKADKAKATALPMGSLAIMQPKTTHFGYTEVETVVQVHGVGPWAVNYVNPADDPRKK